MKKVGVIDYGTGNLRSVVKAFEFIGAEVTMVCRPEDAARIEALVFPGQGTFDQCMGSLAKTGLDELIKNWIESDKPYLGFVLVCRFYFRHLRRVKSKGLVFIKGLLKDFPWTHNIRFPTWAGTQFIGKMIWVKI